MYVSFHRLRWVSLRTNETFNIYHEQTARRKFGAQTKNPPDVGPRRFGWQSFSSRVSLVHITIHQRILRAYRVAISLFNSGYDDMRHAIHERYALCISYIRRKRTKCRQCRYFFPVLFLSILCCLTQNFPILFEKEANKLVVFFYLSILCTI